MDKKEYEWHLKKAGYFSASRASDLLSKSGEWTKGNISYLMEIAYQRKTGRPKPSISAFSLRAGVENEPIAVEWIKRNTDWIVAHCDTDFDDKIFEVPFDDVMFGASPDAFKMSMPVFAQYNNDFKDFIDALIEIKCVIGREREIFYFSDEFTYQEKRAEALEEHGDQLAAQLLAYPSVNKIILVKYLPQSDSDEFDTLSIMDASRGLIFEIGRPELSAKIDLYERRLRAADEHLKSGKPVRNIKTKQK